MKDGVTGLYLRGIVCPDEVKEEYEKRVKNWPSPYCEIPVIGASQAAAMREEEVKT
jgi:hypothetical protein